MPPCATPPAVVWGPALLVLPLVYPLPLAPNILLSALALYVSACAGPVLLRSGLK